MIDCPRCEEEFENGHLLIEHCKESHPEIYKVMQMKMPSLIALNRTIATQVAPDIKPLPGTEGVRYIEEPPSLAWVYILIAATAVVTFTMILMQT